MTDTTEPSPFAVSDLLLKLFSVEECRHFLMKRYPELLPELPGEGVSPRQFFDHLAMALIRRGVLGGAFLDCLQDERPRQVGEINTLRHSLRLSNTGVVGPPQVGFHFRGRLQDLSVEMLTQIIAILRMQTGDASLVAVDMRVGSIKLLVEAQRETCDRLRGLPEMDFLRLREQIEERTGLSLLLITSAEWFQKQGAVLPSWKPLYEIFVMLFDQEGLARFLHFGPEGDHLLEDISIGRMSEKEFAWAAVEQLVRRGLLVETLERLLDEFPRRRAEILAAFGVR